MLDNKRTYYTRGDKMTISTNNYLTIQNYMSSVASNPKLNLSEAQRISFQEVLNETTKEFSKEYAKTSSLNMQNQNMWPSIGAAGMYSSNYNDLLMSGIYGPFGTNYSNPLAGLNSSTSYLDQFYKPQVNNSYSSNTALASIYNRLSTFQTRFN